jgi:hypothetical protein
MAEAAARREAEKMGQVVRTDAAPGEPTYASGLPPALLDDLSRHAAAEFYCTALSRVLHDEDRTHLVLRRALIADMQGKSTFHQCLMGCLVYDMIWSDGEAYSREGIDFVLSNPVDLDVAIPRQVRRGTPYGYTLWDAVREYTHGYRFAQLDDLRTWWAANRDSARPEWARRVVDDILARSAIPSQEDRHILHKVTRHIALLSEDTFPEFRRWWELNREKSQRSAAIGLVDSSIEALAAQTTTQRTRGMDQIRLLIAPSDWLDAWGPELIVSGPDDYLADREFMLKVQEAFRAWWTARRPRFAVGPYNSFAAGMWFVSTRPPPPGDDGAMPPE